MACELEKHSLSWIFFIPTTGTESYSVFGIENKDYVVNDNGIAGCPMEGVCNGTAGQMNPGLPETRQSDMRGDR